MESPCTGIYRTWERFARTQGLYARQGQCDSPVHGCECGVKVPLLMALRWGRHLTHESQSHDFSRDSQSRSRLWLSCQNPESGARQYYVGRQRRSHWSLQKDIFLLKKKCFWFCFYSLSGLMFPGRLAEISVHKSSSSIIQALIESVFLVSPQPLSFLFIALST